MSRPKALGFRSTFVVEHHFTGFGQVSASLNLLTWLGARTKTLRLGTAVLVLPWHNPVLLAEQAATLDLLSGGRLDFGDRQGLSLQRVRRLRDADGGGRRPLRRVDGGDHQGLYQRHAVEPSRAVLAIRQRRRRAALARSARTRRSGWAPAAERSVRQVAERGYNLLLGQYDMPEDVLAPRRPVRSRRRGARPHLQPDGGRRSPAPSISPTRRTISSRRSSAATRAICGSTASPIRPGDDRERFVHDEAETRHLCNETAIFGTADQIARKVESLRAGGVEYMLINFGGSITNIRRFAERDHAAVRRRAADGGRGEIGRCAQADAAPLPGGPAVMRPF